MRVYSKDRSSIISQCHGNCSKSKLIEFFNSYVNLYERDLKNTAHTHSGSASVEGISTVAG